MCEGGGADGGQENYAQRYICHTTRMTYFRCGLKMEMGSDESHFKVNVSLSHETVSINHYFGREREASLISLM